MSGKKPEDIAQEDWDAVDSPPITEAMMRNARPLRENPEKLAMLLRAQQELRAKLEQEQGAAVQLDPSVARYFKDGGGDWQARVNDALREFIASRAVRPGMTSLHG